MKRTLLVVTALSITGCMSVQKEEVSQKVENAQAPVVEAMIEYLGPGSRWVGPATVVISVDVRNVQAPRVKVAPAFTHGVPKAVLAAAPTENTEKMAMIDRKVATTAAAGMTGTQMRELLAGLSSHVQETGQPMYYGCTYPIRVRLVREDGGVIERMGCRGFEGFPKGVSEAVGVLIGEAT